MKYLRLFVFLAFFQIFANTVQAESFAPRIVIIGAGLSGLTTAYRLQTYGYAVHIYEARKRPGGRILTAYFGDSHEELGGKNISDGGEAENLCALIKEMGLSITETPIKWNTAVVFNQTVIPFSEIFENAPPPNEVTYEFIERESSRVQSLGELLDHLITDRRLRHYLELAFSGWEGSSTFQLSSYYFQFAFWDIYQRMYENSQLSARDENPIKITKTIEGGNSCLIESLVNAISTPIHYGQVLEKIALSKNGSIELHFDSGAIVEADYLILTLPCSTLRDVYIGENIIPFDQLKAIHELQYGTNAKLLLPVQIDTKNMPKSIFTDITCTWFNADKSVMTWYYGGERGIFDDFSTESLVQVLQANLPSIYKAYPTIQFPKGITPTPKKDELNVSYNQPVGVSWVQDPFSKGSYSNFGVDQLEFFNEMIEIEGETVRKVFRPINNRIFFAGEHTALIFYATMEGAVESGEKAARMLNALKKRDHILTNE